MSTSRPSAAEARRARRRAARDERQRAARLMRRLRMAGLTVLGAGVVAALAVLVIALGRGPDADAPQRIRIDNEGRQHVAEGSVVEHEADPPASGDHYPVWSRYGVFDEPVNPGYWVHNLEHGAIVLLYTCTDDCEQVRSDINRVYASLPDGAFGEVKLLATPYEGDFGSRFMLIAWNWQEPFDEFDTGRIERFYREFLDRGPERAP